MGRASALLARLHELRQSFDRAFSEAATDARDDGSTLLSIRVGRDTHAVRLSEVAALETRCALTPVPSEHPEMLGIAGLRSAVIAVFDLGALIGAAAAGDSPWLLLAQGAPVAFAFAELQGVLKVPSSAVARGAAARGARVRDVVVQDGRLLPLIDIAGLVADLERRPRLAQREDGG